MLRSRARTLLLVTKWPPLLASPPVVLVHAIGKYYKFMFHHVIVYRFMNAFWCEFRSAGQNFVCGEVRHLRKAKERALPCEHLRALFRKQACWDGDPAISCVGLYTCYLACCAHKQRTAETLTHTETQLERKSLKLKFVCLSAAYSGTHTQTRCHAPFQNVLKGVMIWANPPNN